MASRRLPRRPHAERPRGGELVRKQSSADLQNGWLGRHGTLSLTDDRLVFVPTLLDALLRARRREVLLDEIEEVERFPHGPGEMIPGGKRPRLLVHDPVCVYEFMVGDLDAWFDTLERVYELRRRKGRMHTPRFTRTGIHNMLMAEE